MRLLKSANIDRVFLGLESGNDYIRNTIMKKAIAKEQIIKAVELLHGYDICLHLQNIIGVPHETPKKFIDTIKLNAESWPAFSEFGVFYPYPKTELHDMCVRENLISKNYDDVIERNYPVLDLPYFPKSKIMFYFHNFRHLIRYQYLRKLNPYIFFIPLTERTTWGAWGIIKIMSLSERVKSVIWDFLRMLRNLATRHRRRTTLSK